MIKLVDGRQELYQWDTGRKVSFDGICTQFHFSNKNIGYGRTLDVDAVQEDGKSTAAIPDALLQTTADIHVYAFTGSELDGYTKVSKDFKVIRRDKPADYVYTPPEQQSIKDAQGYADAAKASAESAAQSESTVKVDADRASEASRNAQQSADSAGASAESAQQSAQGAEGSETQAGQSAGTASQALADLLAAIGNNVAELVDGKVPMSQIPATATQEIYTVKSEDELTGLTAQRGDLAELIEDVLGEPTITKTWQCLGDASIRDNWVVWGTSYAVQAGNASTATMAADSERINGMRLVTMPLSQYEGAVKDPETLYAVDMEA